MKSIMIMDETGWSDITESICKGTKYNVVGIVSSVKKECYNGFGIKLIPYEMMELYDSDLVISVIWRRILPERLIMRYENVINIHGGILPKWKGLSSNSWAIINGEKEVGYTVHKISVDIDFGDIYKVYKIPINATDHYGKIKEDLRKLLCDDICSLIEKIVEKQVVPYSQEGVQFALTPLLHPEDGRIDWNRNSQYIYGLFRTMSKPAGTGTYFVVKGRRYDISRMRIAESILDYECISGSVIGANNEGVLIKTKDSAVIIMELMDDENRFVSPRSLLKIGQRLQ